MIFLLFLILKGDVIFKSFGNLGKHEEDKKWPLVAHSPLLPSLHRSSAEVDIFIGCICSQIYSDLWEINSLEKTAFRCYYFIL